MNTTHRHLSNIDCLSFVMCPLLAPLVIGFFLSFLLQLFTVLMKQTRQAVHAIKQSIFLDVYDTNQSLYLSPITNFLKNRFKARSGSSTWRRRPRTPSPTSTPPTTSWSSSPTSLASLLRLISQLKDDEKVLKPQFSLRRFLLKPPVTKISKSDTP